ITWLIFHFRSIPVGANCSKRKALPGGIERHEYTKWPATECRIYSADLPTAAETPNAVDRWNRISTTHVEVAPNVVVTKPAHIFEVQWIVLLWLSAAIARVVVVAFAPGEVVLGVNAMPVPLPE